MTQDFTPAPWKVNDDGAVIGDVKGFEVNWFSEWGGISSHIEQRYGYDPDFEATEKARSKNIKANAYLIAESPNMYNGLKVAIEQLDKAKMFCGGLTRQAIEEEIEKLEEIVAKAEGKS